MKAYLYARVSTVEQEEGGYSIPAQEKLLEDYMEKKGLILVKKFVEASSASQKGRIGFNKMIEAVKSSDEPVAIVVEKTDRLLRNHWDYALLGDLVRAGKVEIHLVKQADVIHVNSGSTDKLMFGFHATMAAYYSDNLAEEVKKGINERVSQGWFTSKAPYGYVNNKNNTVLPISVDPQQALLVKRAFELRSSQDHSLQGICDILHDEGYVYLPHKPKMTKATLDKMLKNVFYKGQFVFKGNIYTGKHKPIITPEKFDMAQERTHPQAAKKRKYAFAGLIKCASCGGGITAQTQKGKYTYYHCSNFYKHCDNKGVYLNEKDLSNQFAEAIRSLQVPQESMQLIVDSLKRSHADELKHHKSHMASIQQQLNSVEDKLGKNYDKHLDGSIPEQLWKKHHDRLTQQQATLTKALRQHQRANLNYIESGQQLLQVASNAYNLFVQQEPMEQRKLVTATLYNLFLDGKTLRYDYKKPFDLFAKINNRTIWWAVLDSNQRPPQCQCDALPTAPTAHQKCYYRKKPALSQCKGPCSKSAAACWRHTSYKTADTDVDKFKLRGPATMGMLTHCCGALAKILSGKPLSSRPNTNMAGN